MEEVSFEPRMMLTLAPLFYEVIFICFKYAYSFKNSKANKGMRGVCLLCFLEKITPERDTVN